MEGPTLQSATAPYQLRIGARGSPLALIQVAEVARRLKAIHGPDALEIITVPISTAGDRSQPSNKPLSAFGGKGLFSKEIEAQLSAGTIDIAVHSSKDMATSLPEGLIMPIFLPREDVRDSFISLKAKSLNDLPQGATIGTSSIRRRAQLLRQRPDLKICEFRGNVGTRLQKLEDGVADATLLAAAGLLRSDQADRITSYLDLKQFPTAPAQGAIGIELRADDHKTRDIVAPLNDPDTKAQIIAERAFLEVLDGSCRTPIAALSKQKGQTLSLYGQILSLDGREMFDAEVSGPLSDSQALGAELGHRIVAKAGESFLNTLKAAQN